MKTLAKVTLAGLVLIAWNSSVRAQFVTSTLGPAGPSNFAILSLNPSGDVHLNGPGTTYGNVGISGGSLSLDGSAGPSVVGNVLLGAGVGLNHPGAVQGNVLNNQNLSGAVTAAQNASTTFANLTPTVSVPGGAINGSTTVNGGAGLNVLNVSGINLGNGQALTLNAPAGAQFVVNNSGGLTLNSAALKLTGGITPNNVVYNTTGSGPDLHTSGGLGNESVINGILLAPNRNIGFAPGLINGELIAGGQGIQLASGSSVVTPPVTSVPEPASILVIGAAGLGVMSLRRRGSRKTAAATVA